MKYSNYCLIVILIVTLLSSIDSMAQTRQDTTRKETKTIKKSAELKKKTPSSSEVKKYSSKTLKTGSKGRAVEKKKKTLSSEGAKNLKQSGTKGPKGAVKSFQKKKSLGTDGIVGPKTINKIDKKKNKPDDN